MNNLDDLSGLIDAVSPDKTPLSGFVHKRRGHPSHTQSMRKRRKQWAYDRGTECHLPLGNVQLHQLA